MLSKWKVKEKLYKVLFGTSDWYKWNSPKGSGETNMEIKKTHIGWYR